MKTIEVILIAIYVAIVSATIVHANSDVNQTIIYATTTSSTGNLIGDSTPSSHSVETIIYPTSTAIEVEALASSTSNTTALESNVVENIGHATTQPVGVPTQTTTSIITSPTQTTPSSAYATSVSSTPVKPTSRAGPCVDDPNSPCNQRPIQTPSIIDYGSYDYVNKIYNTFQNLINNLPGVSTSYTGNNGNKYVIYVGIKDDSYINGIPKNIGGVEIVTYSTKGLIIGHPPPVESIQPIQNISIDDGHARVSPGATPVPVTTVCAQVITHARNINTGEIRDFSSSCLPNGWIRIDSIPPAWTESKGPAVQVTPQPIVNAPTPLPIKVQQPTPKPTPYNELKDPEVQKLGEVLYTFGEGIGLAIKKIGGGILRGIWSG